MGNPAQLQQGAILALLLADHTWKAHISSEEVSAFGSSTFCYIINIFSLAFAKWQTGMLIKSFGKPQIMGKI